MNSMLHVCLRCVGDLLPEIQCNSLLSEYFLEQFEKNESIENSMPVFRLIVGLKTCDNKLLAWASIYFQNRGEG